MKIFIATAIAISLLICGSSFAKDDEPQYQVDITIRYNSVSPEKAAKIARQIMIEHADACKAEVTVKKVSVYEALTYSGTNVYRLPYITD